MDPILRLNHIVKNFADLVANDDISLDLYKGEVLALLGENGAGKTTLMNILFGHYTADSGDVEAFGKILPPGHTDAALDAGIGMVHQHFSLADNLTVLENITLGTEPLWSIRQDTQAAKQRIETLSEDFGLKVDVGAFVADLSVGERQRVEILKALYREARILILDEPTAVLTPQETETLFQTLKKLVDKGMSIIIISHKLHEILQISDRIVVLRRGRVVAETKTADADRAGLAEAMVGRAVHLPKGEKMKAGAPVLEFRQVSVSADQGVGTLTKNDLQIRGHEIIGIAGVSGNGQQAIAALISGLAHAEQGEVLFQGQRLNKPGPEQMVHLGIGRIPEDRNHVGVIGEMKVWENLIIEHRHDPEMSKRGFFDFKAIREHSDKLIELNDIRCQGSDAETRLLSGGNVQKLILARVLNGNPKMILANQPTRGLDVGAIAYVHGKLLEARENGAGVLLISEDLEELLGLSDRIHVVFDGKLSPSMNIDDVNLQKLGLMMSGHEAEQQCA